MSERLHLLQTWLATALKIQTPQLTPLTNDASFRRYFRVTINGVGRVVMDAPPNKENCQPYLDVAQRLRHSGLNAPQILATDLAQGFLLLTDFGSELYLPALNPLSVEKLYGDALNALLIMQLHTSTIGLPLYDYQLLHNEMALFTDWLLDKHLNIPLQSAELTQIRTCFELLSESALSQPQVFVHRDYHSRNLMMVNENNPGILDFQDAVKGAVTYDLVSLLRDCYIAWTPEQVTDWASNYYRQALKIGIFSDNVTEAQFLRWFDWMGIQRHLKASGIFARLYRRDGKSGYLPDVPRTLNYIVTVSAHYPELVALHNLVKDRVLPLFLGSQGIE